MSVSISFSVVNVCSASGELCSVRIRHVNNQSAVGGCRLQWGTHLQETPMVSQIQQVTTFSGRRCCSRCFRADAVVTDTARLADSDQAICWLAHTECHRRGQRTQRPQHAANDASHQLRRHGSNFSSYWAVRSFWISCYKSVLFVVQQIHSNSRQISRNKWRLSLTRYQFCSVMPEECERVLSEQPMHVMYCVDWDVKHRLSNSLIFS